jgi:hypothetical protein
MGVIRYRDAEHEQIGIGPAYPRAIARQMPEAGPGAADLRPFLLASRFDAGKR